MGFREHQDSSSAVRAAICCDRRGKDRLNVEGIQTQTAEIDYETGWMRFTRSLATTCLLWMEAVIVMIQPFKISGNTLSRSSFMSAGPDYEKSEVKCPPPPLLKVSELVLQGWLLRAELAARQSTECR